MVNPFDYIYYKIHNGLDVIGGGRAISATIIVFQINLITITTITFDKIPVSYYIIGILIGIYLVSYYANNEEKILKKYESESELSRKIGNTIVTIYIILTFLIPYLLIRNSN